MTASGNIQVGLFAETRKNTADFCQNLFLTRAIVECIEHLTTVQAEYDAAIAENRDESYIEAKHVELQACQSSLALAAYIFETEDGMLA